MNRACSECGCTYEECECDGRQRPYPLRGTETPKGGRVLKEEMADSLKELIAYVERIGGFMTTADQAMLWRAKSVIGRFNRRR